MIGSRNAVMRERAFKDARPSGVLMNLRALTVLIWSGVSAVCVAAPFDVIIRNGHIIDGTGSPWYSGDVGIRAGRIAAIGNLADEHAPREIDAGGEVVAPGFIDILGQSELTILVDPRLPSKIFQGITTELTGEGESVAPLTDALVKANQTAGAGSYLAAQYGQLRITPDWRSFSEYFAHLEKQRIGINIGTFVGATQVRRVVIGDADRAPTATELDEMKRLVWEAMKQGALGVSSSLEYAPALYAKTDELTALATQASRFGGIYASHIRTEGEGEMAALDEALQIGRDAHIPVEIYHIKAEGRPSFGKMPDVVAKIEAARRAGLDVSADTYAYPAWENGLAAAMPPWAQDGGNEALLKHLRNPQDRARIRQDLLTPTTAWENEWLEVTGPQDILILSGQNSELRGLRGKTLADAATLWKLDPIDALMDLLVKDSGTTDVAVFAISEPDIVLALQQPWVSFGCDSGGASPDGLLGSQPVHPRSYGTFPRVLRKYVREEHKLTLPDAIRKMTALPAQRMRLVDRGVLKRGMWADLVVFDPKQVTDLATFEHPHQLARGMQYVLVNGVPVIDNGRATGALPGKVIRGPGFNGGAAASSN